MMVRVKEAFPIPCHCLCESVSEDTKERPLITDVQS